MTKIIMSGCCGHMGMTITDIVSKDDDAEIVAGIDLFDNGKMPYPVFASLGDVNVDADCVIDFSSPKALDGLLAAAKAKDIPLVLCSTGYTPEQLEQIKAASAELAILKSANMSLGINLILKLVQAATEVLYKDYDIEIVEMHHNLKKDSPSGTALAIADAINEVLNNEYEYVYDRSTRSEQRPKKEIGISAVRGGTIVGDHDVIFAGRDEVIEIKHTAYSKAIFGKGAVNAAKFLAGKPHGMYDMQDVIG
ncbi:MAG: 4-hydroxy-tetrahydrodipicolinate reductase [Lachnospiraceae bacterium]|nr:4-hydroxy-tetrahydrodipicolinate reductase [Lachnospiraceae bacterium]